VNKHPAIIEKAKKSLEKDNVPWVDQGFLLELVDIMISGIEESTKSIPPASVLENIASKVVTNKNLLEFVRRRSLELDALKRIARNLTSSLEYTTVLDAVVREALALVPDSQDAHIFMYTDGRLEFGSALYADGTKIHVSSEPRKDGLAYSVAREKRMIIVESIPNHPLFAGAPKEWQGSIIGIPLMMGSRVVGVMNLARTHAGPFSDTEIRLLSLLADQAAIAILNARLHEAVSHQARSDSLTGLPNRRALDERLDDEIHRSKRSGAPFCVVMMDLDGFKVINDKLGHDIGDEVLCTIAHTFQNALRATDFLARYGGDEMTLILPETDWPQVLTVIDKVRHELRQLIFELPDGEKFSLGVTGGVAIYPRHGKEAAGLLRVADEALYSAKRHKRGEFLQGRPGSGQLPPLNP
jgi:diguanylate cyclase (GGDEF)-like protein